MFPNSVRLRLSLHKIKSLFRLPRPIELVLSNLCEYATFQGAEKQYYVSKRCSTEAECIREINGNMPLCHYIWYEDWKCAECCQGDRCNYYITVRQTNPKNVVSNLGTLSQFLFTAWSRLCDMESKPFHC